MSEKPVKSVRTFKCPSCAGEVAIKALGLSIRAVCKRCNSLLSIDNEQLILIGKVKSIENKMLTPLGSRGFFDQIEWEVIGFLIRKDNASSFTWQEYLLFNPYYGFCFLHQANGHWSLITTVKETLTDIVSDNVTFRGRDFRLFFRGSSTILSVFGEFYWSVQSGEVVDVKDYINPPYMLSYEYDDLEANLSLGRYLEPPELQAAFRNFELKLTSPFGIAANQPNHFKKRLNSVINISLFAAILLTVILLWANSSRTGNEVLSLYTTHKPETKEQTMVSDEFLIDQNNQNLYFDIYSPVNNNWLETEISLVNLETQQTYDLLQAVEYYTGRDSDGSWSEGSQRVSSYINSVPAGRYKLLYEVDSDLFNSSQPANLGIKLKSAVPSYFNYFLAIIMLLIYPLYLWIRSGGLEAQRWSESSEYVES